MEKRELALARRHARQEQLLSKHTKTLTPLKVSDMVSIQNQHGPNPLKWNKVAQWWRSCSTTSTKLGWTDLEDSLFGTENS